MDGLPPEYYESQGTRHPGVVFGVFDTKDECWIGNESGPILFTDEDELRDGFLQARIAAELYDTRMNQVARTRAKRYDNTGNTLKDHVTPPHSMEEAIELKESGRRL